VREDNARAQAVYRSLGFMRFEPGRGAALYDNAAEPPMEGSLRMRLTTPLKNGAQSP
jgi:hypothetical protein